MLERRNSWNINDNRAQKIHADIALMMAYDEQPFSIVENKGFRKLMADILPQYQMPSRNFFMDRVLADIFGSIKVKIESQLKDTEFLSFTTDMWTSNYNPISYMCVTAHWLSSKFTRFSAL